MEGEKFMKNWAVILAGISLISILFTGCGGGGGDGVLPVIAEPPEITAQTEGPDAITQHQGILGIWDVYIDTVNGNADIVPVRSTHFTGNLNNILVNYPQNFFLSDLDLSDWIDQGILRVNLNLRHPLNGFDEYSIFDVMGVFLHNGDSTLAYDNVHYSGGPDAGPNEAIILNPDGYSRWFNFVEFDGDGLPILTYVPGPWTNLPDPSASINPYKIYADGLGAEDDYHVWITDPVNVESRNMFRSTSTNSRQFEIQFPKVDEIYQVYFQYAFVFTWAEGDPALTGEPSIYEPMDFPQEANLDEPFFMNITTAGSDLYNDGTGNSGGTFRADIEVFDWQGGIAGNLGVVNEIERIVIESNFLPGGAENYAFSQGELGAVAIDGSVNSSVFQVEIPVCEPDSSGEMDLWVVVESGGDAGGTYDQGLGTPYPETATARSLFMRSSVIVSDELINTPPVVNKIYDDILGPDNYKNPVFPTDTAVTYSADFTDPDVGQTMTFTWWITLDGVAPTPVDVVTMPVDWSTFALGDYDIWVEVDDGTDATMGGPYDISLNFQNTAPVINFIFDNIEGPLSYKNPVYQDDIAVEYGVNFDDPDTGQTMTFTWWITMDGVAPSPGDIVTLPVDWSTYAEGDYDIYVEVDDGYDATMGGPYDITRTFINTPPSINYIFDDISGPGDYMNPVTYMFPPVTYGVNFNDPDSGQTHLITWWITDNNVAPTPADIVTNPVDWTTYALGEHDIHVMVDDGIDSAMAGPYDISVETGNTAPMINFIFDNIEGPFTYKNPVDQNDPLITYEVDFIDPDVGQSHTITWWIAEDMVAPGPGDIVTMPIDWTIYAYGEYDIYVEVDDSFDPSTGGPYDITFEEYIPPLAVYVDNSNIVGPWDGTEANPYDNIQTGINNAPAGWDVYVDDSGIPYNESLIMVSDVDVISVNFDTFDGSNRAFIDPPDTLNSFCAIFGAVSDASIQGFKLGLGGKYQGNPIATETRQVQIIGGSNNSVMDCYFTGDVEYEMLNSIWVTDSNYLTVANNLFSELDRGSSDEFLFSFKAIYIKNSDNAVIRNNGIEKIRETSGGSGSGMSMIGMDARQSDYMVVKNNLIVGFEPLVQGSNMIPMLWGFRIIECYSMTIHNNTVDNFDATHGLQIGLNSAIGFQFSSSLDSIDYTNNIATRLDAAWVGSGNGFGVTSQSSLACRYSDMWDISDENYHNMAYAGTGAVSVNPGYDSDYDVTSPLALNGDPSIDDWDGVPGGGSRMGCHGGPGGEFVGLLTP